MAGDDRIARRRRFIAVTRASRTLFWTGMPVMLVGLLVLITHNYRSPVWAYIAYAVGIGMMLLSHPLLLTLTKRQRGAHRRLVHARVRHTHKWIVRQRVGVTGAYIAAIAAALLWLVWVTYSATLTVTLLPVALIMFCAGMALARVMFKPVRIGSDPLCRGCGADMSTAADNTFCIRCRFPVGRFNRLPRGRHVEQTKYGVIFSALAIVWTAVATLPLSASLQRSLASALSDETLFARAAHDLNGIYGLRLNIIHDELNARAEGDIEVWRRILRDAIVQQSGEDRPGGYVPWDWLRRQTGAYHPEPRRALMIEILTDAAAQDLSASYYPLLDLRRRKIITDEEAERIGERMLAALGADATTPEFVLAGMIHEGVSQDLRLRATASTIVIMQEHRRMPDALVAAVLRAGPTPDAVETLNELIRTLAAEGDESAQRYIAARERAAR